MTDVRDAGGSRMTAVEVLIRLRRFLLTLAILLFAGAIVELWLVGHTEDWLQWIPFALAIVGILASLLVLTRPSKTAIQLLRIWMALVVLGTLFGVYEHIVGNIAFEREVNPKATISQLAWQGIGGGNPLLAPGILTIAALLAGAATYRHEVTGELCEARLVDS